MVRFVGDVDPLVFPGEGGVRAGSVTVKTARISMTLTGDWTFAGDKLPVENVEGIGRGRSAKDKALGSAIDELVAEIVALADGT